MSENNDFSFHKQKGLEKSPIMASLKNDFMKNKPKHNNRYMVEKEATKDFSFSHKNNEKFTMNPLQKTSSKTPAHTRNKSRINNQDQEAEQYKIDQSELQQLLYPSVECKQSDFEEHYPSYAQENRSQERTLNPIMDGGMGKTETKTENTQDYRKNEDLVLDECKDISNFTQLDIYPTHNKREIHIGDYEFKDNRLKVSRYDNTEPEEKEIRKSTLLFSDEKENEIDPFENLEEEMNMGNKSEDSWIEPSGNMDEFVKESNQSFLYHESSFKELNFETSQKKVVHPEISCDNPLEMDSNLESKPLNLEDLETGTPVKQSKIDDEEVKHEPENENYSRNCDRILSRDNSSL